MLYLSLFPFPPSHEIHRPTLKSSADAQRYSSMANNKHPPPPIPCRLQIDFHPPPTPPHTAYPHPQHLIFLETPYTLSWQDSLFHALCHRPLRFVSIVCRSATSLALALCARPASMEWYAPTTSACVQVSWPTSTTAWYRCPRLPLAC